MEIIERDLRHVARTVAAQSPSLDFDDCLQTIREKWLRFPPVTLTGAWLIARSARNDMWRRMHTEKRHRGRMPTAGYSVDMDRRMMARERLRAASETIGAGALIWLARYRQTGHHPVSERVKACKLRQRLRTD
jgi:hypothetical protein